MLNFDFLLIQRLEIQTLFIKNKYAEPYSKLISFLLFEENVSSAARFKAVSVTAGRVIEWVTHRNKLNIVWGFSNMGQLVSCV